MIETPVDAGRTYQARPLSLGDLMVLISGVAVVCAMPWWSLSPSAARVNSVVAPGWYRALNFGVEATVKSCLALSFFVLFRRWRQGGPIDPAEALPMFIGLPDLLFAISTWQALGIYYPDPDKPSTLLVNVYWMDRLFQMKLVLSLLALGIAATFWRRLSPWVVGILFVYAYTQGTKTLGWYYQQWANDLLTRTSPPTQFGMLVYRGLVQGPQTVLHLLPAAIAIVNQGRANHFGRSWPARSGLILGVLYIIMLQVRNHAQNQIIGSRDSTPMAITFGMAFAVALLVAWWATPTWRRWLGEGAGIRRSQHPHLPEPETKAY